MNLHVSKKIVASAVLGAILLMIIPLGVACDEETTSPSTTMPTSFNITSASSMSVNGLSLSLSLNSTSFQSSQEVKIVIDEKNTLSATNNVPASRNWPMQGLSAISNGTLGTLNYPMGVAIFYGYYTSADISSATPLQLYPGIHISSPMILSRIDEYVFQPSSDIADVWGSADPNPAFTAMKMNAEITVWLTSFTPGVYTVFGGDEWGASVILHFVVSS